MPNSSYKPVQSLISTRQEDTKLVQIPHGVYDAPYSALTYTKCDRNINSKEANYFISFNLPHAESELSLSSPLSIQNPSLQQLNVDEVVICPIPREYYSEIIDGRSLTLVVPQTGSTTKTVVSSTYGQLTKFQNSSLLGNNIAFLFSDDVNLPRTGTTNGGSLGVASRDSWDVSPLSFVNRPPAHAYSNLQSSDINTDQRPWSGVSLAVEVPEVYPTTTNQGYNYDIPVGFVSLDKGFVVLTHPDIVDNIPWEEGLTLDGSPNISSGTTNIHFTGGTSVSSLSFVDININFRTSVVCLALPGEFVFSSNPSWNLEYNLQELQNGTNGFDSIHVTEIGLYNKNNELIAVAKVDRPVEKTYTNLITFNLEIDV